jgi:hypothetical protein
MTVVFPIPFVLIINQFYLYFLNYSEKMTMQSISCFLSIFYPVTIFLMGSCHPGGNPAGPNMLRGEEALNKFAAYWYKGEGEINSYRLEQSRYGEIREGEAIMVFVTEDFSKSAHVKLDKPDDTGNDKVSILKQNHLRRFETGIYDYSMMESVFTPVNVEKYPHSLKTTTTSQDWCGHTFTQFNLDGKDFSVKTFSYFEQEGDDRRSIDAVLLEDELWNRIRISPDNIPTGEVDIIPGTFYSRLLHKKIAPKKARIRFENREDIKFLVLEYLHLDRTVSIGFDPEFPHKILAWTEQDGGQISSRGVLKESIKSAYWQKNAAQFEYLRDTLQLEMRLR